MTLYDNVLKLLNVSENQFFLHGDAMARAWLLLSSFFLIIMMSPLAAQAQQLVGVCHDQTRGQSFALYDNFYMHQVGAPMNGGYASLDPSGLNFIRIPSAQPYNLAFFADWDGRVIQIDQMGMQQIGQCEFAQGYQPVGRPQYEVPQMGNTGIRTPRGIQRIPDGVISEQTRYTQPLVANEQTALACYNSSAGESDFADCMLDEMLGENEHNVYECAQEKNTAVDIALCSIGANGGENEQKIVTNIQECRGELGDDWSSYPQCMIEQEMSEDQARLVGCLKDQHDDGEITLTGTAVCYGAGSFRPNAELTIAMECAVHTMGEPMAFASCTGGRLTERELKKCLTHGVGGNGCFGPNNDIVRGLREIGLDVTDMFGPTNDVTIAYNNAVGDLQNGPGPNNDAVKAITNITNDIQNGLGPNNDIVKALDNLLPSIF